MSEYKNHDLTGKVARLEKENQSLREQIQNLLALEEAVRKDHGGKNVRAHCKICQALDALDAAKRKEEV